MSHRTADPVRRVVAATGLSALGVVLSVLLSVPTALVALDALTEFVTAVVLSELGYAVAALAFLWRVGPGLDYLDFRPVSGYTVGIVFTGVVGLFGLRVVAIAAVQALGLPLAGNSVTRLAEEGVLASLLLLVPVSILVVGPAEELLFRGVVQRYLSESVPTAAAVLIASVLFALVHVPTMYAATPDPLAVGVTVLILFALSILLGYLYVWTENLTVPILVHGFYDALLFGLAYFVLASRGP